MNELSTATIKADSGSAFRIGSPALCLATNSCDIGVCRVNGEQHYITWGRNLNKSEQDWYAQYTNYKPVHIGADDGSAELILPADRVADILLV